MFSEIFSKKITATFFQSRRYFVTFAKNCYTDIVMVEIITQIIGYGLVIFALVVCWALFVEVRKHGDDPIGKTEVTITFFPEEDKCADRDSIKQTKPRHHRPDDGRPPQNV